MPGQLIIGRQAISEKFGGKSSLSESKVQRVLKTLEIEHQIEQQTSNKNRLITVVNWELYQNIEQQIEQPLNNQRTTSEQQVNTNNNIKNLKNKRIKEKELKNTYGEYNHVLLTESQFNKLHNDYKNADEMIKFLDEYMEEKKNYKSDNHNLSIRRWVVDAVNERNAKKKSIDGKPRDPKQAIGEEIGQVF